MRLIDVTLRTIANAQNKRERYRMQDRDAFYSIDGYYWVYHTRIKAWERWMNGPIFKG